jgi:hypothetical protein
MKPGEANLLLNGWTYSPPQRPADYPEQHWYRRRELVNPGGFMSVYRQSTEKVVEVTFTAFSDNGRAASTVNLDVVKVLALRNALNDALADMLGVAPVAPVTAAPAVAGAAS